VAAGAAGFGQMDPNHGCVVDVSSALAKAGLKSAARGLENAEQLDRDMLGGEGADRPGASRCSAIYRMSRKPDAVEDPRTR